MRTAQVEALKPGETTAFAARLDTPDAYAINHNIRAMKNNLGPVLARLRKRHPDRQWGIDSAAAITHDRNAVIVIVTVTRTDGGEDEL